MLSFCAVVVLETWFRVTSNTLVSGWVVFAVMTYQDRRRFRLRYPLLWWVSASMVLLLVGVSLLLGAAGIGNDDRTDSVVPGAVLGGVLFVVGGAGFVVAALWRRRRAVDAELERVRDEQSPSTTADDPA